MIKDKIYAEVSSEFKLSIEVREIQKFDSPFKNTIDESGSVSVYELLPHNVRFDHPVNLKFKVPIYTEFAVLYVQEENKVDKILDVY